MSIWNTPNLVERLHELWAADVKTPEIAKTLSAEFNLPITKGMVVGKADRLGLAGRESWLPPRLRRTSGADIDLPAEPAPAPQPRIVTLFDLNDSTCRWPIGDPQEDDFRFCGKQPLSRLPYCLCHARRAYPNSKAVAA